MTDFSKSNNGSGDGSCNDGACASNEAAALSAPATSSTSAATGALQGCARYWFWLDLEMTGLEPQADRILEAAALITRVEAGGGLTVVSEWESAVFQPPEVLAAMNEWSRKTHGQSGLTARVPQGISEAALDAKLCDLAAAYWPLAGNATAEGATDSGGAVLNKDSLIILCGNSIGQDRKFVDRYLPQFASRLHYRMLDVSSFKIVYQELYGISFKKQGTHRALDDIRESIAELQFYLEFGGGLADAGQR